MPFYKFLNTNGKIDFKKEDADELFNNIIPILEKASENVKLDEELEKQIKKDFKQNFTLIRTTQE